jgi:4-amino-4-deoxy-L-arabinose transferase-like glycosyltransferase
LNLTKFHLLFLIFVIASFFLLFLIDFHQNDDWAYYWSVENFFETGEIKLNWYVSTSIVFQVLLGIIFSLIFGLSIHNLIILTFLVSLSGVLAFYLILKIFFNEKTAILGALIFFTFPIYFILQYSFMTEIYFISLILWALFFLIKSKKNNNYLFLSGLFSGFAFMERFNSLIFLIPFIYFIWNQKENKLINFFKFFSPAVFIYFIFGYWYFLIHEPTTIFLNYFSKSEPILFFNVLFHSIFLLGLGLFPLSLNHLLEKKSSLKNIFIIGCLSFFIVFFDFIFSLSSLFMNSVSAYVYNFGLGPRLLFSSQAFSAFFPEIIHFFIRFLFSFSFFVFFFEWIKKILIEKKLIFKFFSFLFIISFFVLFSKGFFDRYVVFIFPFLLFISLFVFKPVKINNFAVISLILIMAFSFFGALDYYSWNNARYSAIDFAENLGGNSFSIDGGYEYNSLHNFGKIDFYILPGKSQWWIQDDEFIITFEKQKKGYFVLKEFEYFSFLHLRTESIYLLKKNT